MKNNVHTIVEIISLSKDYLQKHGVISPRLDAELLLADVLNCDRLSLYLNFDKPLGEKELSKFRERLQRRAKGEPAAYILNKKEFMSLEFYIDNRVLIPRPETERMVEVAIDTIQKKYEQKNITVIDIGVGSGAIAVSLAYYLKNITVIAGDTSAESIEVAKINAEKHNAADRIDFRISDIFNNISESAEVIISNPPYIVEREIEHLQREIKDFEPQSAINGGADGLFYIRQIINNAPQHLVEDGILLIEIGDKQGKAVKEIVESANSFKSCAILKDYSHKDRILFASKHAEVC